MTSEAQMGQMPPALRLLHLRLISIPSTVTWQKYENILEIKSEKYFEVQFPVSASKL